MMVTDNFNILLRPGLRRDFRDGYGEFPKEYDKFLRTGTMDRPEIEATTMSGLPRQVVLGEGEPYTVIDPQVADKVTYTDTQFGLAVSISQELMENEQYGKVKQTGKWLGRSTRLAQEYEAAALLDDAFAGNEFTGINGEPLISATHDLLGTNGTWSNVIPGNPQLGTLGMQAALEAAEGSVDHMGDPIPIMLSRMIIGVSDEWAAIQLTQNPNEPFTSDNNINTVTRKRSLNYVVNHYMDQTTGHWFVQDPRLIDSHFLFFIKPQFPDWYEKRTRSAYFASRQRFLVYFYDPRGWVGSNPA